MFWVTAGNIVNELPSHLNIRLTVQGCDLPLMLISFCRACPWNCVKGNYGIMGSKCATRWLRDKQETVGLLPLIEFEYLIWECLMFVTWMKILTTHVTCFIRCWQMWQTHMRQQQRCLIDSSRLTTVHRDLISKVVISFISCWARRKFN